MKKKVWMGLVPFLVLALAVGVYFISSDSFAQQTVRKIDKVAPQIKQVPQLCNKPDLAQWQDNLPLGPKGEFPFEGPCKNCWTQVGVMRLPAMSVWLSNKGMVDAPASKAKLSWASGKPPYQALTVEADVPAIKKGEQYLLTVTPPADSFFQIAKQIELKIDSRNQIDECNENNNTLTFKY